jgi:hypothetical protein
MKRIIVNLVSEQTTPNFLFIKEMIQLGDELLFISSDKFKERIDWVIKALAYENRQITKIILPVGIEEKWSQMIELIKQNLSKDKKYIVNLTCGTKFMISAVPKAFDSFEAEFYYIPFPKNIILKINGDTDKDITYRMSVKEYFECNNTEIPNHKQLSQKKIYTNCCFKMFLKSTTECIDVVEGLRAYREKPIEDITKIEKEGIPKLKPNSKEYPIISCLSNFLQKTKFPAKEKLTKYEIQFLTGGWFEEYIYSLIRDKIQPNDIALGVGLPISENKNVSHRDLDVVFTLENKLFVIECKTGIDKELILNETVYKAAALKNERLGKLSAYTSIFSLSSENERFKDIAKAMNISYYDRSFFVDEEKFQIIISDINKKAKG